MRATRRLAFVVTGAVAAAALVATTQEPATSAPVAGQFTLPLAQSHRWMTDAQGRAVVLHGLNQVFKVAPYTPSADGFGDDDAAFLADNGFDAVRVGVIWAAVEPQPGVYDDAYLNTVAQTVHTLASHGIVSMLDFHQDLYNEKFQGEGAPAWAVQDGGLPNPALGFPLNYFANPAENHAWDRFWANAPAADGVGLQDHYAHAWAHVAARFRTEPGVVGYEVVNEPWPGTLWQQCAVPIVGCPLFDASLTAFYRKVSAAIRTADTAKTMWIEPNVISAEFDATEVGRVADPHLGWAFHDYCPFESELQTNTGCTGLDNTTMTQLRRYSTQHDVPWLLTEFGATDDLANLAGMMSLADRHMLGWMEWAYTGNDITSSSPNGQALVLDPSQPPTGANVKADKLRVLAEAYPKVVAGTPTAWATSAGDVFSASWSTLRPAGLTRFPAGSETDIAVPLVRYPHGYTVTVAGGTVASAAGATTLRVLSAGGATTVRVTVTPAA